MSAPARSMWRTPGPWLGLLMGLGTAALAATHALAGWPAALALLIVLAIAGIALIRSFKTQDMVPAFGSAALVRYNLRMLIASMAYVIAMMIAVSVYNGHSLSQSAKIGIALLPTLPALAMVWAMARYLIDENDEYLRHRASLSAIIGLGVVLVIGTVWGFMETFGIVPHVWAWWVVPVWALGLGLGQAWISRRDQTGDRDIEREGRRS